MALSPSVCCLCENNEKSCNHLFIHCPLTVIVWSYFLDGLSLCFVMLASINDVFCQWGGVKGMRGGMFVKALLHGIVWGIWKKRNRRIF